MKSFEYKGLWWLSDREGPPLVGTLSFNPENGGKLEITERIDDHSQPPAVKFSRNYDIIYGAAGGAQVTLVDCSVRSQERPVLDLRISVLSVSSVHLNRQRANPEKEIFEESSLSYSQLTLSYTHLNEWMGPVGFTEEGGAFSRDSFDPIVVVWPETQDEITFWYGNSCSLTTTELVWKNQARITIRRHKHTKFNNYQWYTYFHLVNLLTLATGEPNFPQNIKAYTADGNFETEIFYKVPGYAENTLTVNRRAMLFHLDDIVDELQACLSNWFAKSRRLWQPTDVYIETVTNKSLRPQTKFLLLAQALEGLHRNSKSYEKKYIASNCYKPISIDLISHIPPTLEDPLLTNLRSRIEMGNEYSLQSRLEGLCDKISEYHNWLIPELVGDKSKFAKDVKTARNQLTHHLRKSTDKFTQEITNGLRRTQSMEILFRMCLLLELELPEEKTKELLQRFRSSQGQHFNQGMW